MTRRPVMAEAVENNIKQFYKVIIIGAGMGGLSAANTLLKNGMTNFRILEATNKIGGRIEAVDTGNLKLEMGANYIHGILGNPMYEIALNHGLIDITHSPKTHNLIAAMEDGTQIPFTVLQEIYEAYTCFLKRCEEYFLSQYLPPEGITNVGDHIKLEIELYLDKVSDSNERHIKKLIFDSLLKRETCITGVDNMKDVDLLELGSYTELQGGNIVLPGGFSNILNVLASDIPPENIILNHAVSAINWTYRDSNGCFQCSGYDSGIDLVANDINNDSDSDKTVTGGTSTPRSSISSRSSAERSVKEETKVEASQESEPENLIITNKETKSNIAEIICDNCSKFYCQHVICTIPLGVLKEKADTLFSPKLPQDRLESIKKLSFGTVNKIYLEYSRPFLHPEVSEIMLLWNSDDFEDENNLDATWFKKIYSFFKITETLIMGWISGKEAIYMETLSNDTIGQKCTEILRKFLSDPFIPLPKFCICSKWYSREHSKGSYTSIAVGASHLDIKKIAQPLGTFSQPNKPVLLFAGEHTHSSFYSTVHGAYISGENAANFILDGKDVNNLLENEDSN